MAEPLNEDLILEAVKQNNGPDFVRDNLDRLRHRARSAIDEMKRGLPLFELSYSLRMNISAADKQRGRSLLSDPDSLTETERLEAEEMIRKANYEAGIENAIFHSIHALYDPDKAYGA